MLFSEFLPFIVGLVSGILGGLIGAAIWRKKLQPLQESLAASEKKAEGLDLSLNRQKNKFADLKSDHQQLSATAANWERKYILLEKEAKALRAAKDGLERKYQETQESENTELIHLRQQSTSLTEQLAEHDEEITALKAQLASTHFEKTQAQENLSAAKSQGDHKVKGNNDAVKRLQSDMDQLRRQAGASAALIKQLEIEKAQLTAKIVELEGDLVGVAPSRMGNTAGATEKATPEAPAPAPEASVPTPAPRSLAAEVPKPQPAPAAVPAPEVGAASTPDTLPAGAKITLPSGATIKQDDLKMVEGVGPKIEELLQAGGITTWRQLADAPVEQVQKILDEAGPRYRIHQPTTWAKQALMAAEAQWAELEAYQDHLIGGREPEEEE